MKCLHTVLVLSLFASAACTGKNSKQNLQQSQESSIQSQKEAKDSLSKKISEVMKSEIKDSGILFSLNTYSSSTKLDYILLKEVNRGNSKSGILDEKKLGIRTLEGTNAVNSLLDILNKCADDAELEDERMKEIAFWQIASEAKKSFLEQNTQYKSVKLYSHFISEDGDTEYHILVAEKLDHSWVTFKYENNPF